MARHPRMRSEHGLYHVMLRGNNKQVIFEDDEDYRKLQFSMADCKLETDLMVYAYCIMTNHVHMLIKENSYPMSHFISRLGAKYVWWYNKKYERCGHLFQGRFRSEPINNTHELFNVLRYIHQNPVKAGLEASVSAYRWSSFNEYVGRSFVCETAAFLRLLSENRSHALDAFRSINRELTDASFIDVDDHVRLTDADAVRLVGKELPGLNLQTVSRMTKCDRTDAFLDMHDLGLAMRQIARLTGVSYGMVRKAICNDC